ncbi:MAG: hypothetical protein CMK92_06870, partial [Pseudomonas sp.]|nr:hypothetical protein [Pseudomonas sp.]
MCGICIWISKKGHIDPNTLKEAISLQNHRGPNGINTIFYDDKKMEFLNFNQALNEEINLKAGFAHSRLSIIDLSSRSDQPMLSDDLQKIITYNGEIYNYKELKQSLESNGKSFRTTGDTEVLLKWLETHNGQKLHQLNGMWSFSYFNKEKEEVIFSRDRYGQKPLLFYSDENNFIAASEYKSIFHILAKKRVVNKNYLLSFLMQKKWPSPKNGETFYKDIFTLLPGETITYNIQKNKFTRNTKLNIKNFVESCDHEEL